MVNRKIENYNIVEAEPLWGGEISISVNDPDGGGFSLAHITIDEAKAFVREIKAAIKQLEAADG